MFEHIARFPECPAVVASREFTCLDTTSTTTGTLRDLARNSGYR
jgi:hypothetical protein